MRAVTSSEPEWDETQRSWMLALAKWRDQRCNRCGGDLEETTDEENDGTPGHSDYRPLPPLRCHRCTALSVSEDKYRATTHPHALIHRVELHPPRRHAPG